MQFRQTLNSCQVYCQVYSLQLTELTLQLVNDGGKVGSDNTEKDYRPVLL